MPINKKSSSTSSSNNASYLKLGDFDLPSGDKVKNAYYFSESNTFKFNLDMGDLTLYDASYRKAKDKDEWFLSGPSHQGKDEKWYAYWFYKMPEDDLKALEKFLFNKAGI